MKKSIKFIFCSFMLIICGAVVGCNTFGNNSKPFTKLEKTSKNVWGVFKDISKEISENQDDEIEILNLAVSSSANTDNSGIINCIKENYNFENNYADVVKTWQDTYPVKVLEATLEPLVYAKIADSTGVNIQNQTMFFPNAGYYLFDIEDNNYVLRFIEEFHSYSEKTNYIETSVEYDSSNNSAILQVTDYEYEIKTKSITNFSREYLCNDYYLYYRVIIGDMSVEKTSFDFVYSDRKQLETFKIISDHKFFNKEIDSEEEINEQNALHAYLYDAIFKDNLLGNFLLSNNELQELTDNVLNDPINMDKYNYDHESISTFSDDYREEFMKNFQYELNVDTFHIENNVLTAYTGKDSVVSIPEGVVKVSSDATLSGEELIIPSSLEEIEINEYSRKRLANLYGFRKITIADDNKNFYLKDGYLFNKENEAIYVLVDEVTYIDTRIASVDDIFEIITFRDMADENNFLTNIKKATITLEEVRSVILPPFSAWFSEITELVIIPDSYGDEYSGYDVTIDEFPMLESLTFEGEFVGSIGVYSYDTSKLKELSISFKGEFNEINLEELNDNIDISEADIKNLYAEKVEAKVFEIPNNVESFNVGKMNVEELIVPEGCKFGGSFESTTLRKLTFLGSRESVDADLYFCPNIEIINLPDNVKTIKDIYKGTNVKNITIPASAEGELNICNCPSLEKIEILPGSNITSLYVENAPKLTEIINSSPTESLDLHILENLQTLELAYPNSLTEISFIELPKLTDFKIPSSVTEIRDLSNTCITDLDLYQNITSFQFMRYQTFNNVKLHSKEIIFDSYANITTLELADTVETFTDYEFGANITNLIVWGRPKITLNQLSNIKNIYFEAIFESEYEDYLQETNSDISSPIRGVNIYFNKQQNLTSSMYLDIGVISIKDKKRNYMINYDD